MPNLDDNDWEMLIDRILDGKCTPFLGAGVNYGFLPTGKQIANDWAAEFGFPLPDRDDLARVAQFVSIRKDPMWPKEEVVRRFRRVPQEQDFTAPDNPLGILADLPLSVYMTTNYDDYMLRALRLKGKDPKLELCRWNDRVEKQHASVFDRKYRYQPTIQEPVVFHLHGHQSMAESLVLHEDDYLAFLVKISKEKQLLPARIQQALAGTSLLFIGYKLADWDFRVLLHGVLNATDTALRRISVSVQLPPEVPEDMREKACAYLERYFEALQVRIFWGSARDFADKLRKFWARRANGKVQREDAYGEGPQPLSRPAAVRAEGV